MFWGSVAQPTKSKHDCENFRDPASHATSHLMDFWVCSSCRSLIAAADAEANSGDPTQFLFTRTYEDEA